MNDLKEMQATRKAFSLLGMNTLPLISFHFNGNLFLVMSLFYGQVSEHLIVIVDA